MKPTTTDLSWPLVITAVILLILAGVINPEPITQPITDTTRSVMHWWNQEQP